MSELLSQEEVKALLQNVPGLDAADGDGADRTLDDTAGGAYPATTSASPHHEHATRYDFKHPSKISKGVLERLHFVYERYAKSLTASISTRLRAECEVTLSRVEQRSYSEFTLGLPVAACINLLRVTPQGAPLALEISPALVFAAIERLLGGNSKVPAQQREVTALELNLLEGFIATVLEELTALWQLVGEADFVFERCETSPQMINLSPPTESVAVVVLEVTLGQANGAMSFCLPSASLAPFEVELPQRAGSGATADIGPSPEELARLDEVVAAARVSVSANIDALRLPVGKLLELEVGATLPLDTAPNDPATVSVTGIPRYKAAFGARNGHKAVRIIDTIENDDTTREQEKAPFKPVEVPPL